MRRSTLFQWFAAALPLVSMLTPSASLSEPRIDYMLECQGCHLADGSGSEHVPALKDSVARFLAIAGGRAFLVQVPGSALSPLGDDELAGVLNWIVAEFGPEAYARNATPYNASEVRRLRRSPLVDVEGVRRKLIRRFNESSP